MLLFREGFVVYEAVMELRTTLDSLQAMKGITSDEKGNYVQPFALHSYVCMYVRT